MCVSRVYKWKSPIATNDECTTYADPESELKYGKFANDSHADILNDRVFDPVGLKTCYKTVTGEDMIGKDKWISMSGWNKPSLTERQIFYAASDSITSCMVYEELMRVGAVMTEQMRLAEWDEPRTQLHQHMTEFSKRQKSRISKKGLRRCTVWAAECVEAENIFRQSLKGRGVIAIGVIGFLQDESIFPKWPCGDMAPDNKGNVPICDNAYPGFLNALRVGIKSGRTRGASLFNISSWLGHGREQLETSPHEFYQLSDALAEGWVNDEVCSYVVSQLLRKWGKKSEEDAGFHVLEQGDWSDEELQKLRIEELSVEEDTTNTDTDTDIDNNTNAEVESGSASYSATATLSNGLKISSRSFDLKEKATCAVYNGVILQAFKNPNVLFYIYLMRLYDIINSKIPNNYMLRQSGIRKRQKKKKDGAYEMKHNEQRQRSLKNIR